MKRCSQSRTAAGDSIAGASSGRATATASAPIANTLAASIPVRMPPDATSGTSGSVCRTSSSASAVGMPHSASAG